MLTMTLEVTLTHFYNPCLQYFRYCSRKPNYSLFALLSCHNNTYKRHKNLWQLTVMMVLSFHLRLICFDKRHLHIFLFLLWLFALLYFLLVTFQSWYGLRCVKKAWAFAAEITQSLHYSCFYTINRELHEWNTVIHDTYHTAW